MADVSFVIVGRNDGYMGDYLYRLGTSLSFLGESAQRAGLLDGLEIVMVDWASERPLSAELPLTAAARRVTRFLEVTPEIVAAKFGSVRWVPTCAVNVGVRRARGRFIFFTDSDCLWTEEAMAALRRLLRGEAALAAPIDQVYGYVRRYQLPWATAYRKPRLAEWRRIAALTAGSSLPEMPAAAFMGGFSAGQLMHRDLWWDVRGYDETLDRPWGWADNDLMLRVCQQHAWLDVSGGGFAGLHMEHWPQTADRATRDPSTINPMTVRNVEAPNGPEWGLAEACIHEATASAPASLDDGLGCAVPLTGQTLSPVWRPAPEAGALVQRLGLLAQPHLPAALLQGVAQVALADRPRSVCWYGEIEPTVLQTIVAASPGAEIVFVNPWPEGVSDHLPFHPAALSGYIQAFGFQGWARVLQGDVATAMERLVASSVGDVQIELAWAAPDAPEPMIRGLADRLAPGGVILLPAPHATATAAARLREQTPGCETRVLGTTGLMAITRRTDMPHRIDTMTEMKEPESERARSLRVVLDMLLRDKALGLVEPNTLPWDEKILVIRSAHMGRMEAFFQQVAARAAAPQLHVLSHAHDEAALRSLAPFSFTFHAWTTPGPYRLDLMPPALLERLRAQGFATLFFLDQGTSGDRLDEVERLLAAIRPAPIVGFLGNGKFAQAPDAEQRRLAEAAFLRLIEWYQFRLDPDGASLASTEVATAARGETR